MTFQELGINNDIIRALENQKITEPSAIQCQTIPHILTTNSDLVAISQTGTGKTAAFCLPILQKIDVNNPKIQALVLVPTRELGQQVAREFFLFSKFLPRVFAEAVYGGTPIDDQIEKLKRPTHVVVATPGRLVDLLNRNAINLDALQYLVLDEADEMINMGFKPEIDLVLDKCSKNIVKMLFTATMLTDVDRLIKQYLNKNAVEIRINAEEQINEKIKHRFLIYEPNYKLDFLKAFLIKHYNQRGILFCATKSDAKRLGKKLAGFVVSADALHGNLNQEMREKVLRGFKKERINLLIATDIAARGLDVKELDYVIHFHLPENAEQYTHRSGRTARAGNSGISVCLVNMNEMDALKEIESGLNISFSAIEVEVEPEIAAPKTCTIYMNMGLNQEFERDILRNYLEEEGGLNFEEITNVVVEDDQSNFDIPAKYFEQLSINLKHVKRCCRNMKISQSKPKTFVKRYRDNRID